MNSPPATPDPSRASDSQRRAQVAPLSDATVEMERPKDLAPASDSNALPGERPSQRRPRSATKRFETDSPGVAPPKNSPLDATVDMARPANFNEAPRNPIVSKLPDAPKSPVPETPPALSNLDATVDMARPNLAPAPDVNATVEMERPAPARKTPVPTAHQVYVDDEAPPAERKAERRVSSRLSAVPAEAVDLSSPDVRPAIPVYARKLGEVLVSMGKLSAEQVEHAVAMSSEAGERIGRWLIRWELLLPETLCRALSIQTGLPMTMLDEDAIPESLRKMFPLQLMMHHNFVPFDDSGAVLCVAACSPLDPGMLREQEKGLHKVIEVFLAREDQVARQLDWLRVKLKTRSRRSIRFDRRVAVSYQFCNRLGVRLEKDVHTGTTVNISEGGFLLEGPVAVADPSALMLKGLYANVCIKSMTGEIWSICEVREIRLIEGVPQRWLLGMEILDINPECKTRLKGLCKRLVKPA